MNGRKRDIGSSVSTGKEKSYCLGERKHGAGSSDKQDKLNKRYKNGKIVIAMSVKE